jgi:hypothetical protein
MAHFSEKNQKNIEIGIWNNRFFFGLRLNLRGSYY